MKNTASASGSERAALGPSASGPNGPLPARPRRPRIPRLPRARAAVLERLADQPEPIRIASLAALMHQHPNTVREHLEGLVELGLATREAADPAGRGRPAWLYTAVDFATTGSGTGEVAREYAGLAAALAAHLSRASADPRSEAVEAGEAWGRQLAQGSDRRPARNATAARREVVGMLEELGFAPEADARAAVVRLRRCPLLEAAHQYPDVVCGVHLGLVRGALDELGGDPEAADLRPFAEPGACRLDLLRRPKER